MKKFLGERGLFNIALDCYDYDLETMFFTFRSVNYECHTEYGYETLFFVTEDYKIISICHFIESSFENDRVIVEFLDGTKMDIYIDEHGSIVKQENRDIPFV